MKKILSLADLFLEWSDWRDLALVKLCLFAAGVIAGTQIPTRQKKYALITALTCFAATFGLLMYRFVSTVVRVRTGSKSDEAYDSDFEDSWGVCAE